MHAVQSFCSCIGKLLRGSEIEALVCSEFGGLTGIINGKSWVRSMRAYRIVSTFTFQSYVLNNGPTTFQDLSNYLDVCRQHQTVKFWIDNLLIPSMLIHQLLRSEREGDFQLQKLTLERMLPYFFVAGNHNYARYITYHLLEMRYLLTPITKAELISGAFLCVIRRESGMV